MKNKYSYWVSTPKMTGLIVIDEDGAIVETAPIFKKWINKHIYNFNCWVDEQFNEDDVQVKEITNND